jgi:Family of unknown function (DUF6625)
MPAPLIMLIPYFGRWPEWIDLLIESCKWNPEVHWRFYTDCGQPENQAKNVDYVHLTFGEYKALVRKQLNITFDPVDPYKLCDLKPCLGAIHSADIESFPFFGYGDIDVIYGNIRSVYTDDVLAASDVFSTHTGWLSGHFAVFRNNEMTRTMYQRIVDFEKDIENPKFVSTCELPFANAFRLEGRARLLFTERYSTVLSRRPRWHDGTTNYPDTWFWKQGRLTNDLDGDREFLYLHFMRWKGTRYINKPPVEGEAAWLGLDSLVNVNWRQASSEGFSISRHGFNPLTDRRHSSSRQRSAPPVLEPQ